jgi:hypothetical protein
MDETTYEFKYTTRDRFGVKSEISVTLHGDQTWMDLAEAFGNYLQGCGYGFDTAALAEALDRFQPKADD